jgi:predicted dehydrogenase
MMRTTTHPRKEMNTMSNAQHEASNTSDPQPDSQQPSPGVERRTFLRTAAAAGIGLGMSDSVARVWAAPSDRVRIAVMGVNGRGSELTRVLTSQPNTEMVYICDVDSRAIEKGIAAAQKGNPDSKPTGVKDVRKVLDDKSVDALVIAAPDHWHAPAAILAVSAGKHVYVEKPCSQNPHEGEMLVAATRKHQRIVQMGSQRRSWPNIIDIVNQLRDGSAIGRVYYAKGWYTNTRPTINVGKPAPVPDWLDYELWQGPAPRRPFKDNLVHYNWHWFWHWGTGEACNNGTHEIDVMRWGLGVDYPKRVVSGGGRYQFQDDWEFPDTQVITYDFDGRKSMMWETRSCNGRTCEGLARGIVFYGENGSVQIDGNGYTIFDQKNKVLKEVKGDEDASAGSVLGPGAKLDAFHLANFLNAVRTNTPPSAEIEHGHKSVLLCHLGNIAWKTGHALNCDASNGKILNDPDAMKLWQREYEKGWEPKV